MERTRGSQSEIGMIYQYAITAYIAGQLSTKESVKNYIIYSSAKCARKFDDIVAKIQLKDRNEWFLTLIQVKHKDNKKLNITDVLKGKRVEYVLSEYISSFNEIIDDPELACRQGIPYDNIRFCIFCNQSIQTPAFLRGECTFQVDFPKQPFKCDFLTKTLLPFGDKCWKFQCQDLVNSEYQRFFDGCHLYLGQENYVKINKRIQDTCGIDNANDIVNYVKDYFNNNLLFKQGLHKQVFEVELQKIRLSNSVLPFTMLVDLVDDSRVAIWNEITLDHDITIVDKGNDVDIEGCLYACLAQRLNVLLGTNINWNETVTKHEELSRDVINKFIEFSKTKPLRYWISPPRALKSLILELWKLGGLSLILRTDTKLNSFEKYLHLKRSYVVIGDAEERFNEISSSPLKIFSHVGDIKNLKLRDRILENTVVSLQARKETTLKNVLLDDMELLVTFSSADIIGLMKKRIAYLKEDCLFGSNHLAFIIEDGKSPATVDLTEKHVVGDNITIECQPRKVKELVRTIEGSQSYKNYTVYSLRRIGRHLELVEGDRSKLSHYFIDQFGDPVYVCGGNMPIPIIGHVIPANEINRVDRYLRRVTLSSDYLDLRSKAVLLISGDVKTIIPPIKFTKIKDISNAERDIKEERRYFIKVKTEDREDYWNKFAKCAVLDVIVRNGKMELVRYKNCSNLISGVSFDGRRFSEREFFDEIGKNAVTVVTGEPGMGKSSMLKSLCNSYCESFYILFYDLLHFQKLLRWNRNLRTKPIENVFKEFHSGKVNKYNNFLCALREKRRIILMLDAFDEIIPSSEKQALEFMQSVTDTGIQIIVASRLKDCGLLMDKFNVSVVKLDPLSTRDDKEYPTKWKLSADALVNIPLEFTTNPLYLNFLQVISESGGSLAKFNRYELYEKVVDMKIERRLQTIMITSYEFSVKEFVTLFEQLALVVMFGKEETEKALRWKCNTQSFDCIKFGIVTRFEEDCPVFDHFTFVEFLVAQWLVKAIQTDVYRDVAKTIYKQMMDEGKIHVVDILSEHLDIHKAVLDRSVSKIREACGLGPYIFKDVDKLGRTVLHLATICCRCTSKNSFNILNMLIQFMRSCDLDTYQLDAIMEWDWTDYVNFEIFTEMIYGDSRLILELYLDREVWKVEKCECTLTAFPIANKWFKLFYNCALKKKSLSIVRNLLFLQNCKKREFCDLYKACMGLTLNTEIPHKLEIDVGAGLTALHIACIYDSELVVRHLIEAATNIDVRDEFGYTPLLYIIMQCMLRNKGVKPDEGEKYQASVVNKAVIEMLLEKGANVDIQGKDGVPPLHVALLRGDEELIRLFLEKGADVNIQNLSGCTPLHIATREQVIRILLEKGANVNIKDAYGSTPLHKAVYTTREEIVRVLLEQGVDVDVQDDFGVTPLHIAAEEKEEKIVRVLLEKGANVNLQDKEGRTPLHIATCKNWIEISWWLLEKGANTNLRDSSLFTPLHSVVCEKDKEIRMLLKRSVHMHSQSINIYTPLTMAIRGRIIEIVQVLLENGANINVQDDMDGYTPLHWAVTKRNEEIVQLLMEKDANINIQNKCGNTPLEIAVAIKHEGIIQLLKKSANVNIEDKGSRSPLPILNDSG